MHIAKSKETVQTRGSESTDDNNSTLPMCPLEKTLRLGDKELGFLRPGFPPMGTFLSSPMCTISRLDAAGEL